MLADYAHLEVQVMRIIVLLGVLEESSSVDTTYIIKLARLRAQMLVALATSTPESSFGKRVGSSRCRKTISKTGGVQRKSAYQRIKCHSQWF